MPSPYRFKQYGNSGKWVDEIFPHVAQLVDEICFVHSMHTDIPEHAGAMMMMNAGHLQPSRPSMGSWLVYGLGTENHDLPGFIAMSSSSPAAEQAGKLGQRISSGAYSGSYVNIHEMKPDRIIADLKNTWLPRASQRQQADLLTRLNQFDLERRQQDSQLEASIQAMEMAFRMQFAVPDAFDTSQESQTTLEMYGDTEYAKGCLLARRLVGAVSAWFSFRIRSTATISRGIPATETSWTAIESWPWPATKVSRR